MLYLFNYGLSQCVKVDEEFFWEIIPWETGDK